MFFKLINIFLLIQNSIQFSFPVTKVVNYKTYIKSTPSNVYEPFNVNSKQTSSILFFTGANSIIPGDVYSDFINKLASLDNSIYIANNNITKTVQLANFLKEKYSNLTIIGHSSGCVNAILTANELDYIDNLILLDPVDNRFLNEKLKINNPFKINTFIPLELKPVKSVINAVRTLQNMYRTSEYNVIDDTELWEEFEDSNFEEPVIISEDPVSDDKNLNLNNVKNLLFLNAALSYKWELFPPKMPFDQLLT